jgi:hypothetical protein
MTSPTDPDLPDRATWWKISHVAPSLGFTVDLMLSAIEAGQLPIRAETFGQRGLVFVSSADVLAYLRQFVPTEGQPA